MNPVMLDVKTRIETDRLILRMPKPGDGKIINEAIKASINELRPWLAFARENPSVEDTEINTRQAYTKFLSRESLRYLVFRKKDHTFIGSTGFHNIQWEIPKLEIGYWIDTKYSGKGYMREGVGALTLYALNELNCARVEIQCESENKKSRAIPEALGFDLEGVLRNEDLSVDGKRLTDTCIYAKICK